MFVSKPDRHSSDIILAGRVADPKGFVTLHRELDGLNGPIKVYFSVTGLQHLAQGHKQVGLVPVERLTAVEDQLAAALADLNTARERLEELEAAYERISGLSRDGFKVQRVMGRPKGS